MKDNFAYWGYNLAWTLLKFLPEKLGRKLFSQLADRIYQANKRSVQQLRANLKQVTKLSGTDLEDLVKLGVNSYFKYWYEAFVLTTWSKKKITQFYTMSNKAELERIISQYPRVVIALPHMGNWDAAAYWFTTSFRPLTTVAEKLSPVKLYEKFVKFRTRLGVEVLPLERNSDLFHQLLARLKSQRIIALLSDRDISRTGIKVNFFNAEAAMPAGPAALAYAGDAIVVTIKIYNSPTGKILSEIRDVLAIDKNLTRELAIEDLTQRMAKSFEAMITEHPQDWHLMQRLWPEVKPIAVG